MKNGNCLGVQSSILSIPARADGSFPCDSCGLHFCSESCRQEFKTGCKSTERTSVLYTPDGTSSWHAVECSVFSQLEPKLKVENFGPGTIAMEYGSVSVLRLLYLR